MKRTGPVQIHQARFPAILDGIEKDKIKGRRKDHQTEKQRKNIRQQDSIFFLHYISTSRRMRNW
jgi:hypothetical protein